MREIIIPANVENPPEAVIPGLLARHLNAGKNPVLFSRRDESGVWRPISTQAFNDDARAIAKGLMAHGIESGDRVAIMSRTRYEWTLLDFAIGFAGAISVPVYETSSPSQVAWILQDSGTKLVLVENAGHENVVRRAVRDEGITTVQDALQIDGGGLDTLRTDGAAISDETLDARTATRVKADVATIIYTSGTTGRPKGCELTHANFLDLSDNALSTLSEIVNDKASTLMFLPLAHVFARYIAILAVTAGSNVGHTPDLKNLLPDLASFQPTFLLAVPRVFEKVFNSALQKADDGGKGKIFRAAAATAVEYSRASLSGNGKVALGLKVKHAVFDKLVYSKLRTAMGGRVAHAVSGGGPLGERLGHFFNGLGITILEGFGLTETTAPISVNTPQQLKIGSVGRPLPGNGYRIADDGEILVKGDCVFLGYLGRPDLTEEAFVDGWFKTGDIGELDEDGFMRITGRKKEIIVTAGGKNVVPAQLEDQIRSSAIVSQCVVVGDQRKFIGALVTIDEEALPGWLNRHNLPAGTTPAQLVDNAELLAEIQVVVDRANESVSHAEAIKKFRVVASDFTEESGHLTPSLKIKRATVLKDFSDEVEALYAN